MRSLAIIISILAVLSLGAAAAVYFFLGTPTEPKIVLFIGQRKLVLQDDNALVSPRDGAELAARLSKGMRVQVVGIVEGQKWTQVTLPDKRVAYFPASDLELSLPAASTEAQSAPAPAPLDDGPPIEFEPVSDVYTIDKSVTVYLEPNVLAPQRYQIDAGTSVPAVARSKDGTWVRASTEDGQPAFLKVADLGPPQTGKAVVAPLDDSAQATANTPDAVEGTAKVVTTSRLEIAGTKVQLSGLVGDEGQTFVQALQDFIKTKGNTLHCDQQLEGYLCKSSDGTDIGLSALSNGWARAKKDAAPQYQKEATTAQQAGLGVWHQ